MPIEVDDVKALLSWNDVVVEERLFPIVPGHPKEEILRVFRICPRDPGWPSIKIVTAGDEGLDRVEFGAWEDYHFDGVEMGFLEGLVLAQDLMKHELQLTEELDRKGRVLTATISPAGEELSSLSNDMVVVRRVLFDREPEIGPVDESKYVFWNGERVLRSFKEKIQALERKALERERARLREDPDHQS